MAKCYGAWAEASGHRLTTCTPDADLAPLPEATLNQRARGVRRRGTEPVRKVDFGYMACERVVELLPGEYDPPRRRRRKKIPGGGSGK